MAPLEASRDIPSDLTVFGINRVEPRESNSRPVFGRVFLFLGGRYDYRWNYRHAKAPRRFVTASLRDARNVHEAETNLN